MIGKLLKRRARTGEDGSIVVEGARKATGGKGKARIVMTMAVFFGIFSTISAAGWSISASRTPDLSGGPAEPESPPRGPISSTATAKCWRPTSRRPRCIAEPRRIVDADEAIEKLSTVLPEIDYEQTYHKLKSGAGFVWLQRAADAQAAGRHHAARHSRHRLPHGEAPLLSERRRPSSYIVGLTNIDNQGIAGMEKYIDEQGLSDLQASGLAVAKDLKPVKLSIDLRVQHVVRDEIAAGAGALPRDRAPAPSCSTSRPAKCSPWPRCRISIRTIPTMRRRRTG